MDFKTPQQIQQERKGMNLTVEEIGAACVIARQDIADALERWPEQDNWTRAKISLSEPQWNVARSIIEAELQESEWEIIHQNIWPPDGGKGCVVVDIAPLVCHPSSRSIKAAKPLDKEIDWEKIERIYWAVGKAVMVISVTIGLFALLFPIMGNHLDEILESVDSVAPTGNVESKCC